MGEREGGEGREGGKRRELGRTFTVGQLGRKINFCVVFLSCHFHLLRLG